MNYNEFKYAWAKNIRLDFSNLLTDDNIHLWATDVDIALNANEFKDLRNLLSMILPFYVSVTKSGDELIGIKYSESFYHLVELTDEKETEIDWLIELIADALYELCDR